MMKRLMERMYCTRRTSEHEGERARAAAGTDKVQQRRPARHTSHRLRPTTLVELQCAPLLLIIIGLLVCPMLALTLDRIPPGQKARIASEAAQDGGIQVATNESTMVSDARLVDSARKAPEQSRGRTQEPTVPLDGREPGAQNKKTQRMIYGGRTFASSFTSSGWPQDRKLRLQHSVRAKKSPGATGFTLRAKRGKREALELAEGIDSRRLQRNNTLLLLLFDGHQTVAAEEKAGETLQNKPNVNVDLADWTNDSAKENASTRFTNANQRNKLKDARTRRHSSGELEQATGEHYNAKLKCRVEKDFYLEFEKYRQYTCVNCYKQVPGDSFTRKLGYRRGSGAKEPPELYDTLTGRPVDLSTETHSLVRWTFKEESIFDKWQACCRGAIECCLENRSSLRTQTNTTNQELEDEALPRATCPATWDGLTCWPESPAGQLAWHECPRHVYFLSFEPACAGFVTKQCFANGSWFIRNGHEWSDYSQCPNLPVYAKRMQFSALWHIISALVITPALLTIDKFSNRGANKRVKILRSLLFWLLINSCIQAIQKSAIVGGLFEADSRGRPPSEGINLSEPVANRSALETSTPPSTLLTNRMARAARALETPAEETLRPSLAPILGTTDYAHRALAKTIHLGQQQQQINSDDNQPNQANQVRRSVESRKAIGLHEVARRTISIAAAVQGGEAQPGQRTVSSVTSDKIYSSAFHSDLVRGSRCKRQTGLTQRQPNNRRRRSALITFFCWFLVVASRTVRLMCYSWMFTGAIYLCSALHFAPAEPPAVFIRILMILTNAFPIVIAVIYITSRTLVEPSPLNIIFKVPYYKLTSNTSSYQTKVEELWQTELECWFDQSKYESIEDIADLPNLILVCLNVGLFVITLIILCRISRPGSTRPEMSPLTYFKAAGTLVVLYGGHYALLAYRPNSESCLLDTFMFYSFLFVDGIQGVAVSYVFCYRTHEGKKIIKKYWDNKLEIIQIKL